MPRLNQTDMEQHTIGGRGFTFSGTKIAHLGSTEYTLVSIAVDETGSVQGFQDELRKMLIAAVDACKKSPRSDNILVRVLTFSDRYPLGVNEMHGFKPLAEIDPAAYPEIQPGGMTPLFDACYSSIGAVLAYGDQLSKQDFGVNGIAFIITDGCNNASTATAAMVKEAMAQAVKGEQIESMISVLVGVNTQNGGVKNALEDFRVQAGLTQYVDVADATPRRLAKLADFVSTSVSSQSQSLGTGGPSQQIAATI